MTDMSDIWSEMDGTSAIRFADPGAWIWYGILGKMGEEDRLYGERDSGRATGQALRGF